MTMGSTIKHPIFMPDTRLPFKGSMAFNRNSQEYVPFYTETDAMLASLMLAYRLASPILAVVLALVRHPSFNPADITLSKPEDVWARVAEHTAAKRPCGDSCLPFVFPHAVINEVVDILAEERMALLHVQRDTDGPHMGRIEFDKTDRDLRNVSLVCKNWTQPAQRALGRVLALQDVRRAQIVHVLRSPLFGPWTREAIMFRHVRELDEQGRAELLDHGNEVWGLIAQFVSRMSNIRTVSLCTDWFEIPLRHVTNNLVLLPIQELRLVQAGDIAQLLGAVCRKITHMTSLRHLYLQYSGVGSAYTDFVPSSELEDGSPCPAFEKLSLKIGNASALSLRYISWLTRPREGENGFRLKSLSLDLVRCYYSEQGCFDALAPCLTTLSDLWINVSGLSEGLLTRILRTCRALKSLTIIIRHTFDNSFFHELPETLEDLSMSASFEKPDWTLWDERLLEFFNKRCPRNLRCLSMNFVTYNEIEMVEDIAAKASAVARERGIVLAFTCGKIDT